jgi:tryptophanyl-tRNA synthetase
MSKSSPNPANYLSLTDSPEITRKKIKVAVTDSGKEIKLDLQKPAISNLLMIYHLLSEQPIQEIEKKYQNKGYADFKNDLAEIVVDFLKPFQEKFQELGKNEDYIKKVLSEGAEKAQVIAEGTMKKVRKKIGLIN